MKIYRNCRSSVTPFLATAALLLGLIWSACATRKDVAQIVAQSNAAILAGQFGLPALPGTPADKPSWQDASDRIEIFIAAHPDQPATTAPLRIRQAMLLLSSRQPNLAQTAFDAAPMTNLHTGRDQALKRNQDTLLWWFSKSTNDTWTALDHTKAQTALANLKQEQSQPSGSPEIRDYFAEMRAWIALAASKQTTSAERARTLVEDALNVYADVFTPDDLKMLESGNEQPADLHALGPDVRRRLRSKPIIAEARARNLSDNLGAHPQNSVFNKMINP